MSPRKKKETPPVLPRPTCPACRQEMPQTSPGLFSCCNYSGGCVNTRRKYFRDGTLYGGR